MRQLIIDDLDFCQSELPEPEKISGAAKGKGWDFFAVDWDFDFVSDFTLDGDAGAGYIAAIGLVLGKKLELIIKPKAKITT